jgi:hypothetical protein
VHLLVLEPALLHWLVRQQQQLLQVSAPQDALLQHRLLPQPPHQMLPCSLCTLLLLLAPQPQLLQQCWLALHTLQASQLW